MRVRVTRCESNRAWPDVATRLTIRIMNEPPDPHRRGRAFADALATVAAADRAGYLIAIEDVLESFETRTEFLEDVPVADTVLVLQLLAAQRDAAVDLPASPRLP